MHPNNSNSQSQRWLPTSDAQIVTRVIEIDNHLLAATDKPPRIKRGRDANCLIRCGTSKFNKVSQVLELKKVDK